MKKERFASLLLCAALCISGVFGMAFAADNEQIERVLYVGGAGAYDSIQSALDSDEAAFDTPATLKIVLQGPSADAGEVSIPTDKNIAGVVIAGEEGAAADIDSVSIYANGIPLTIEGGNFKKCRIYGGGNGVAAAETSLVVTGGEFDGTSLFGGGKGASSVNTNLTVKGGAFLNKNNLYGGAGREQGDAEAQITGASRLTLDNVAGDFNTICGGSSITGDGGSGIGSIVVNITGSTLSYDSLLGGSMVSVRSGLHAGHSIGSISMTVADSALAMVGSSSNGLLGGSVYSDNNDKGTNPERLHTGNLELRIENSDVSKTSVYVLDSMYLSGNGAVDNASFVLANSQISDVSQCYAGNRGCVYDVGNISYTLTNVSAGNLYPVGAYGLLPTWPEPAPKLSTDSLSITLEGEVAKEDGLVIYPRGTDFTPDTPSTIIVNDAVYIVSATAKIMFEESDADEISVVPPEGEYIKTCTVNGADQTQNIQEDGTLALADLKAGDVLFVEMAEGYRVSYAFESGTPGKDLPASIAAGLLPDDARGYASGTVVTPQAPMETEIPEVDGSGNVVGTWKFEGYGVENVTVDADVTFTGVWKFTPAGLSAPAAVQWDDAVPGKAVWEAVNGAGRYLVELYRENTATPVATVETTDVFYSFSDVLTQMGTYTFRVKALSPTGSESNFSNFSGDLHTVFLDDGASSSLQLVKDGGKVKEPAAPSKESYTFGGWHNGPAAWDFVNGTVSGPMTLNAKWLSQDTGVEAVSVDGVAGVIEGDVIKVELPAGSHIPAEKEKVGIVLSDAKASIGDTLSTADNGRTWTFVVTAEDNISQRKYTVFVSVGAAPQPARDWTITVSAGAGGSATGGGTYADGASVTVRAVPNGNYRFVRWEENGKTVSTEAEYSFTASGNRALTAVFQSVGEPAVPQTGDGGLLAGCLALMGAGAAGLGGTLVYKKKKKHGR